MKYHPMIFDFDGTLVDSGKAIMGAIRQTFIDNGMESPEGEALRKFVGPPPQTHLMEEYDVPEALAWKMERAYREHFRTIYWRDVQPYPGVVDMLKELKDAGGVLAIATTRPRGSTDMLVDALDLRKYFAYIATSPASGAVDGKTGQIGEVLAALASNAGEACMVGDRIFDMQAARDMGVPGIFAAYGYGTAEEVAPCAPVYAAESIAALRDYLLVEA